MAEELSASEEKNFLKEFAENETWIIQGQEVTLRAPAKISIIYQLVHLYTINPMMGMCAAIVACARTKSARTKSVKSVFNVPYNPNITAFGMSCIEAVEAKGWSFEDIQTLGNVAAAYLASKIKLVNEVVGEAIEVAEDFLDSKEQKEE